MKLPLTAFTTAVLCISLPTARAVRTDCLDEKRYNLETVCRTTCEKEDAAAFSVSYDDTNDTCRCHGNIDGLGVYTGNAHYDATDVTCYSLAENGKIKVLGYGDCTVQTSDDQVTTIDMKFCDYDEQQEDCVDEMSGYNRESICRNECSKSNSAAFAVSHAVFHAHEDYYNVSVRCQCYSNQTTWTASDVFDSYQFMCYSMMTDGDNNNKMQVLGYGDCVPKDLKPVVTDHLMKKCVQEPNLRGSTSLFNKES